MLKYLTQMLPPGGAAPHFGPDVERFNDRLQMAHPDYIGGARSVSLRNIPPHEPVYALTEGLAAKSLAKAVRGAVSEKCRRCRNGSVPETASNT